MFCQRCGSNNGDTARFCNSCGAQMPPLNAPESFPDVKIVVAGAIRRSSTRFDVLVGRFESGLFIPPPPRSGLLTVARVFVDCCSSRKQSEHHDIHKSSRRLRGRGGGRSTRQSPENETPSVLHQHQRSECDIYVKGEGRGGGRNSSAQLHWHGPYRASANSDGEHSGALILSVEAAFLS